MESRVWKNINDIKFKNPCRKPYAYEISYIVPFGVELSLERREYITITSDKKLSDELVINSAALQICQRFENDDQYDLIPDISITSIKIIDRYCPRKEL